MRQIFISLVRPHMDYCAQLWAPSEGPLLDKLEKLIYDFSKLMPEVRHMSYEDRLKELKIQSAQRRYERYDILYIRKIMMGLVPNCGISVRRNYNVRNGVTLDIPNMKGMSKLRCDSFCVRGPKLFNSLPAVLRNMTCSMDTFKDNLDQYLSLLPDKPRIDEGCKLHSNSLDSV